MDTPSRLVAAIIADDLTGALDAAAPYAIQGFRVAVALTPDAVGDLQAVRPDVVSVNTDSRELGPDAARRQVDSAARRLRALQPELVYKKIDSRLKGHPAVETATVVESFGRTAAIVCPAIPGFGRIVESGRLSGFGVEGAIEIAKVFGGLVVPWHAPDTACESAFDPIAAELVVHASTLLGVGARSLSAALAARLAAASPAVVRRRYDERPPMPLSRPVALGIGSTDPITRSQVDRLRAMLRASAVVEAPNGLVPDGCDVSAEPVVLMMAVEGKPAAAADLVAHRFGDGFARVATPGRRSLVLSGGATAQSALTALGIGVLDLRGELLPGLPWAVAELDGREVIVVTKSGGFGTPETLVTAVSDL